MTWNGLIFHVPSKDIHTMTHRRLPIGIQSFRRIREQGCYYVDKTPLIQRLIGNGDFYFLSRPRRFGKSLLVDTLRELFEGNESLFRDLAIHDNWDWSVSHPVVRLSFGGKYNETGDVERSVLNQLVWIEEENQLKPLDPASTGPERLQDILRRLHRTTGQQVVVLVDEYDKPILDVIDNSELAAANRDYLRGFYGIIKDSAEHVRFVFVTGVSRFSRVSLFSGLNNLEDMSLDPEYAAICGYTDADLDTVFAPELPGLARDQIRKWYNGYHWRGEEKLYNPFDVLLLFRNREFRSWWFETGSPTFLFRLLVKKGISPMELENRMTDAARLSRFDVDDMDPWAVLFQTGYLTITGEERIGVEDFYILDYPNLEVRQSFSKGLLSYLGQEGEQVSAEARALIGLLVDNDFDGFTNRLRSLLAGIPHQWYDQGNLDQYEAHYLSVLYAYFRSVGVDLCVEDSSSRGRADMVVFEGGQVFVLEFKMAKNAGAANRMLDKAMEQMRERGYGEKYRARGGPVHLVGVVFGSKERKLLKLRSERL